MHNQSETQSRDVESAEFASEGFSSDLVELVRMSRRQGTYPFWTALSQERGLHRPTLDGVRQVSFAQNDYLGLSVCPEVIEGAVFAARTYGTSRSASPVAGGHTQIHAALEREVANFVQRRHVGLFPSGYQANVGVLSALAGPEDLIVADLYNHASLVDGARLSGATVKNIRHNDLTHLEQILRRSQGHRRRLVVVEALYSADGDVAPLVEMSSLATRYGAELVVDEAHSIGVLGPEGRGLQATLDPRDRPPIVVGTFSKAFGACGAFVACDDPGAFDQIRHGARSLVFSTAIPPPQVGAASAALRVMCAEPQRRAAMVRNTNYLAVALRRQGVELMSTGTPILPIRVGGMLETMEVATALSGAGILVCPAVPPMVPATSSRLRLHVRSNHEVADLDRAARIIGTAMRSLS